KTLKESRIAKSRKRMAWFLILLLTCGILLNMIPVHAQTTVEVINPATGDHTFTFLVNETAVGTRFNATVWIYEVTDLYNYQVYLEVNDTLLNITRAWIPDWDPDWIFTGQTTFAPQPVFTDFDGDDSNEAVTLGCTLMGAPAGLDGNGTLAVIEFEILYAPPAGETATCDLDIDDPETFIQDSLLADIAFTPVNGTYEYIGPPPLPIPEAAFTYSPLNPLVNETVTFDASASVPNDGSIVNYTWNFGDGTPEVTETDPIITHNFTDVGTYNVTLLVFNDLGYNDTTWKLVTVSLPTAPEAIFTYYPTIVVANYTVTFNATESIPNDTTIVNYTWNFGDGTPEITETDPIVTHNFTSAGTYNVTLTVFNDANANDTTWQLITVLAEPPEPMLDIQPSTYVITHVGQTFNVTVRILNVTTYVKLVVTQFRLLYNSTYLTLLNVTEGPFFEAFPQRPDPPYTFFVWTDYPDDELYGSHVAVGNMLMPNDTGYWPGPFPEGDGVLATLTFNVTEGFNGMFPLDLTDTIMLDNELNDITHSYTGPASVYSFFEIEITKQPTAWYNVTTVASMSFTIRYWNGTYYTPDNYSSIVVKVFDGTDYIEELAVYPSQFNPSTNEWTATWIIPPYTPYLDTYQFVICAHDIEDNAGNTGPLIDIASSTFEVTGLAEIRLETLEVTIDVGSMHFPGEIAEFYILTTVSGFPCEVTTITATLYKPDGTNESLTVTEIDDGLFKADYIVPDLTGTYTLVVEASLMTYELEAHGASLRSFLVSSTLSGWITKIDGDIAWIKTNITDIKVSLDAINARLTSIEGTLATIETDVGTLQTTVDTIQANITSLIGTVAIIDSTLGQIELDIANLDAKITSLIGTVAIISTTLGDIEASLDDLDAKITSLNGTVATISTTLGDIEASLDDLNA
ncbi:hypothetical protein DRO34_07245, partial [Candidatus Bathyarchaeota archaeon]